MLQTIRSFVSQLMAPFVSGITMPRGPITLSRYFPRDTDYFYGYPTGTDSKFFNPVSPWVDELASGRPLLIAGPRVNVVTFAASVDPEVWLLMTKDLGLPLIDRKQVITLPKSINASVRGPARNRRVKQALADRTHPGKFVMAQPYLDDALHGQYRIAPEITTMLNDKQSIAQFVPTRFRPRHYETFPTGAIFAKSTTQWPFPCVVKVTSSGAGDGVRICFDRSTLTQAKRDFRAVELPISVEEFVLAKQNLGVLFGVPQDQNYPIEVLSHHLQVTTNQGVFLGALFNVPALNESPTLPMLYDVLGGPMLSRVRSLGWYGIGGIDVLLDQRDRFYVIDANFRVTSVTPFSLYLKNENITTPLISFTGTFRGTLTDFRAKIVPLARPGRQRELLIVALTRGTYKGKSEVRFNAGIFFDSEAQLMERANRLRDLGVRAAVLENLDTLSSLRNVFTTQS